MKLDGLYSLIDPILIRFGLLDRILFLLRHKVLNLIGVCHSGLLSVDV